MADDRPSRRAAAMAARQQETDYRNQLEGRATFEYSGRIKAPPALRKEAARFGGRYRGGGERGTSGLYDWFYELDPAEQARIRQNWMSPTGVAVDELEENIPIGEWLEITRRIDASKALQTGRTLSRKRYGGLTDATARAGTLVRSGLEETGVVRRCRFFTDSDGVVHPIRSTCGPTADEIARGPSRYVDEYDEDF